MDTAVLKQYLLDKPEVVEDYPFGDKAAVFKVRHKMFALISTYNGKPSVNLKCDPEQAFILRDIFDSVIPGYHMNKKHWNTVILDGSIASGEIQRMVDHSYSLVVKGMPKSERQALELAYGVDALYCGQ